MKEGHGRSESSVPFLQSREVTPPPSPSWRKAYPTMLIPTRRRPLTVIIACTLVVSLGILASWTVSKNASSSTSYVPEDLDWADDSISLPPWDSTHLPPADDLKEDSPSLEVVEDEPDYSPYVLGPPTQSFRDNLRNDTKYITSWISAGWSTLTVVLVGNECSVTCYS